ncbi:DUF4827 domain-containing protein [Prevotella sp.]|uniref:DUF4827 domain-containing protein n=1 Tax=Prevotella sp. TaxID=59823 RepID=UPI00307CC69B
MKTLKFLALTLLAIVALASCSDSETYADMKKKERSAINRYIANQKIKVISEDVFNAQNQTTNVDKNEWVLFEGTGVYMQIVREGCGKKLESGKTKKILCRFNEYNILESDSSLQCSNIDRYPWLVEKMTVKNTSGTFSGTFDKESSLMYNTYNSTAVPSGWLVPLTYIKLGRPASATDEIAKVKLIVPHSMGQSNASQNVYPCMYEITYQKGA